MSSFRRRRLPVMSIDSTSRGGCWACTGRAAVSRNVVPITALRNTRHRARKDGISAIPFRVRGLQGASTDKARPENWIKIITKRRGPQLTDSRLDSSRYSHVASSLPREVAHYTSKKGVKSKVRTSNARQNRHGHWTLDFGLLG